jgi:drug/metabolite transporter (DMT)-like permease
MQEVSRVMKPQNELHGFPLQNESNGIQRQWRFFHPYLQLSISIVLTAAAQIFLKIGVDIQLGAPRYGFLVSLWIWAGVFAILVSLFSWLYALKSVPLIVAFNLAATNHILVAIGAWAFLGEKITQQRWLGICMVALGAFFIARPSARAEEQL